MKLEKLFKPSVKLKSDLELLVCFLSGIGIKKDRAKTVARQVLHALNLSVSLSEPNDLASSLQKINGIGAVRSVLIEAVFEFMKRRLIPIGLEIKFASDIIPHLKQYTLEKKEHFLCITLDATNVVIGIYCVSKGLINMVHAHPREVFICAIMDLATSVIVAHNHPSENTMPSNDDRRVTERLKMASKIIGIKLLDHIIITSDHYYSFREADAL
jgi:DNA repair protein RadC